MPVKHLILYLLLIFTIPVLAQEKKDSPGTSYLTGGFGVMEVLNLGFDYEKNNSQLGFKMGGLAADDERIFSFTGEYSYYFAGNSRITGNRTWFGKIGLQYFSDKSDTFSEKATGLIVRGGKKFYFSEKAGVKMDFGFFFRILHEEYHEQSPFLNWDMPVMPGIGISFFYQL